MCGGGAKLLELLLLHCAVLCLLGEDVADILSEDLAELDTPLVEGVNSKEEAFYCNTMLIKGEKLPTRECSELS